MSVGNMLGYGELIKVNMCKITNSQMITNARIVYKANSINYLEGSGKKENKESVLSKLFK